MKRRAFLQCLCALPALGAAPISYAANDVDEFEGLPRGTVDVYAGRSLVQRQPLSLSATHPRGLVISPDNRYLVVAAFGGGVYNVLPVKPDGTLEPVCGIFKEVGCGPHPTEQTSAHPHSLTFDPSGRFLVSSDFGCDRLSVFRLSGQGKLVRQSYLQVDPGSGPGAIAFDRSSLTVQYALAGGYARCHFDGFFGKLSRLAKIR